jgi:uncharacterized protein
MRVFEHPGPSNTQEVIEIVKAAAERAQYLVIASITGDSAIKAARALPGQRIICVTCPQGMNWEVAQMQNGPFADIPELRAIREAWIQQGVSQAPMQITPENRRILEQLQVHVLQGTIPFFGPSFSIRVHLQHLTALDIMAKTLELISTGTLVCLESVLMAADAGLIPEQENVLAMAGTERGLDTAWVIKSSASANLFHATKGCRFVELLAKTGISVSPDVNITYLR